MKALLYFSYAISIALLTMLAALVYNNRIKPITLEKEHQHSFGQWSEAQTYYDPSLFTSHNWAQFQRCTNCGWTISRTF